MSAPTPEPTDPTAVPATPAAPEPADGARASLEALRSEIAKAVVGQDPAVTGLVVALLCRGHVLLEGVPGVAKTLLVRSSSPCSAEDTSSSKESPVSPRPCWSGPSLPPSDSTPSASSSPPT